MDVARPFPTRANLERHLVRDHKTEDLIYIIMLCLFIQEFELENKDLQERLSLLEAQLRHTLSEKVNIILDACIS